MLQVKTVCCAGCGTELLRATVGAGVTPLCYDCVERRGQLRLENADQFFNNPEPSHQPQRAAPTYIEPDSFNPDTGAACCLRCGNSWQCRNPLMRRVNNRNVSEYIRPKRCATCRSPYWDKVRTYNTPFARDAAVRDTIQRRKRRQGVTIL